MGILIDKNTRVVIQGITGKEGSKATREMLDYGTVISCGVTPGKSGSTVEGLPVFDGVKEAIEYDPRINTSVIYVPPLMVFDAAVEAIRNGIKTVLIFTENVPSKDSAKLVDYASRNNARVIGPSSIGLINVGVGKLGSIGGSKEQDMYSKGKIGIISKSGGMCAET
ncbi:MAG TPA: CoA-binding protein, partial [Alphaproteobacteria bacterium]|nr:CoA-binding protein [Alphaproteobacteria bacterium]